MVRTKHRALRVVLFLLAVDAAIRGLLTIFASKWALNHSFPSISRSEITTLLLLINRESGALDIGVSLMLFRAFSDPERNAAVIDGIALALVVVAATTLVSIYDLRAAHWFSVFSVWGHSLLRLAIAGLLVYFRPREHAADA